MPVYDYVCSNCHRLTEVVHGITADGPHFCPECGAEGTMTKVFSAPSVHFKGSGWAKKDRTSSSRASARSKESGSGDSKSEGSSSDGSSSDGAGSSPDGGSSADKAAPKKTDGGATKIPTSGSGSGSGSSSGSGAGSAD